MTTVLPCMLLTTILAASDGPVAHWPMDHGSGDTIRDVSGHGNDGVVHGGRWITHGDQTFLTFDGVNDFVDCGNPPELDLRGPSSLSLWVWPDEVPPGEVGIVGKHYTSYLISMYSDGHAYWYVGSGANNVNRGIAAGRWNHVVGTFDGKQLVFYVDGDPLTPRSSQFDRVPSRAGFSIGCVIGDPDAADGAYRTNGYFKGRIADVQVYDRPLSSEQVTDQYNGGRTGRFAPVLVPFHPLDEGVTISDGDVDVIVANGGAMQVSRYGGKCAINSSFSYPGETIGQIVFGGADSRPRVSRIAGDAAVIEASCADYKLRRTVRVRDGRVDVEDQLTSTSDEPVGVLIRNEAVTEQVMTGPQVGSGASEPFLFASATRFDLGVVGEDFVSRAHFAPSVGANVAAFDNRHFALSAGWTHTFKWSVYLLPRTGDVYALVNRVRSDWGVNHTLVGPASFVDVVDSRLDNPDALRAWLERRPLAAAMPSTWLDYDPGALDHVPTRDEYKTLLQRIVRAYKAIDPNIKILGSLETDWIAFDPGKLVNGDKLPVHDGSYSTNRWMTPEETRIIDESSLPWKDSAVRDANGNMRIELYTRGGEPQIALGVIPGPGNYQSKFLMEQARFLCEEVGLDGYYIDEFAPYWYRSSHTWDGYTVDIDGATGQITSKYVHPSIYGRSTRLDLCRYAAERGLVMICNTFSADTDVARYPTMRFAETWSNFNVDEMVQEGKPDFISRLAAGRLGTPIGLGMQAKDAAGREAELMMRGLIAYLRHGAVYYHYNYPELPESGPGAGEYGPINHMFPLTPKRLFEGGIVGEERTVTCISGTYAWRGEQAPRVITFDRAGRETTTTATVAPQDTGWLIDLQLDDWNQIAVIEGR